MAAASAACSAPLLPVHVEINGKRREGEERDLSREIPYSSSLQTTPWMLSIPPVPPLLFHMTPCPPASAERGNGQSQLKEPLPLPCMKGRRPHTLGLWGRRSAGCRDGGRERDYMTLQGSIYPLETGRSRVRQRANRRSAQRGSLYG